jgi:hypothetical protein
MAQDPKCEMPSCPNIPLVKLENESTWMVEKFYCPKCGRTYHIATWTGTVAQGAPLAVIGGVVLTLVTHDWDHAVERAADMLDGLFS